MIAIAAPQASSCSPGSIRIAVGAALFACTNAAATALYRRGGASVVSLYVIRSPIVYLANVLLVALQDGRPAATNVLLLRTGSTTATRLALARSLLNTLKQILLSVAFVYLTYADACASLPPPPSRPSPPTPPTPLRGLTLHARSHCLQGRRCSEHSAGRTEAARLGRVAVGARASVRPPLRPAAFFV